MGESALEFVNGGVSRTTNVPKPAPIGNLSRVFISSLEPAIPTKVFETWKILLSLRPLLEMIRVWVAGTYATELECS